MPLANPPSVTDPLLARIIAAFDQPRSTWRTARGIGRELNVPTADVEAAIRSRPDRFRQSSIAPAGIPLFGLRKRQATASAV